MECFLLRTEVVKYVYLKSVFEIEFCVTCDEVTIEII